MRAEYSFEIEPARRLLVLRMSGFFDLEAMAALDRARHHAQIALGCAPNTHRTLMDVRRTRIRCEDVRTAFCELLGRKQLVAHRISLLVADCSEPPDGAEALDLRKGRWFDDPTLAEAWLFDEAPVPASRH